MRIEYKNKFSDMILFQAVHQFLSPAIQGVFLTIIAVFFYEDLSESSVGIAGTTAFLWYLSAWVVQFTFNVLFLLSKKNTGILTTHVVEVLSDGFLEETKFNKSLFYWPGVIKVVSRPGFVAVYVSQHAAHVIAQ